MHYDVKTQNSEENYLIPVPHSSLPRSVSLILYLIPLIRDIPLPFLPFQHFLPLLFLLFLPGTTSPFLPLHSITTLPSLLPLILYTTSLFSPSLTTMHLLPLVLPSP